MIVDLSHLLETGMPVFPGSPDPVFEDMFSVADDGYTEKKLNIFTHLGTHIDAPAHMLKNGETLDILPVNTFFGKALRIDLPEKTGQIELSKLVSYEKEISDCEFVIFNSGWWKKWGGEEYFEGFPHLTPEAAEWLSEKKLKGVGGDFPSFDPVEEVNYTIHNILFNAGYILVENLTNLDAVTERSFTISVMPLKVKGADGSPVRAVALLNY